MTETELIYYFCLVMGATSIALILDIYILGDKK